MITERDSAEKHELLFVEIKNAVSPGKELLPTIDRIKRLHSCSFDPEIWIEEMSACMDSANEVTRSDVEDFLFVSMNK